MGGPAPRVKREREHLQFDLTQREPGRKTDVWTVFSDDLFELGHVRWYSHWRRYVFEPAGSTVIFDATCLTRLAAFLADATAAQKAAAALAKRTAAAQTE